MSKTITAVVCGAMRYETGNRSTPVFVFIGETEAGVITTVSRYIDGLVGNVRSAFHQGSKIIFTDKNFPTCEIELTTGVVLKEFAPLPDKLVTAIKADICS